MKIYINSNYEIKAINTNNDITLHELEIDRDSVFGDLSDYMILNYCYKPREIGYSIYPSKDYSMLELLDKQESKISILQEENEKLKESQVEQDTLISSMQEAVDFILLSSMPTKARNINLGGKSMANYIALRIIQKGEVSEKAGQDYYVTFLTHPSYARFKEEVDVILKASGNENLIVDLTNL